MMPKGIRRRLPTSAEIVTKTPATAEGTFDSGTLRAGRTFAFKATEAGTIATSASSTPA
jgi:alpha-D-ribose 1-methylphosphonate 5-triphosphate diphosphatase PhnM